MENWEIAELPGTCPTSYKILDTEIGTYLSLISWGLLTLGIVYSVWIAWRRDKKFGLLGFIFMNSVLLPFPIGFGRLEWQELVKSNDIRENIGVTPGRIVRVERRRGRKEYHYYGTYTYKFEGQEVKGTIQLFTPYSTTSGISVLHQYSTYHIGRRYTVLYSKKHPDNSVIDLDCPQSAHK